MSAPIQQGSAKKIAKPTESPRSGLNTDEEVNNGSGPTYILIENIPSKTDVSEIYVSFGRFGEVKIAAMVPADLDLSISDSNNGVTQFPSKLDPASRPEVTGMKKAVLQVVEVECAQTIIKTEIIIHGWSVKTTMVTELTTPLLQLLREANSRKMFVFGLKKSVGEEFLKKIFGKFGSIENVRIVRHRKDNRSKGFGFVIFRLQESKQKALSSGPYHIHGKQVNIVPFESPDEKKTPASQDQPLLRKDSKGTQDASSSSQTKILVLEDVEERLSHATSIQPLQEGDFQPEYKFNRSRIISSAAVVEYFRRNETKTTTFNLFSTDPVFKSRGGKPVPKALSHLVKNAYAGLVSTYQ